MFSVQQKIDISDAVQKILQATHHPELPNAAQAQEINFLLAGDISMFAGANGEPGGKPSDIGREQVLARNRHTHLENGPQQHHIRGLAAGTVDGGHLDAQVVNDAVPQRLPD